MTKLIFKNFIRSNGAIPGLLFLLFAGLVALYSGQQFLHKQRENIDKTAHFQQESIERNVHFFNKEMGLLLYYLRFAFVNETPPIAALSIGQRDVNPSVQSVTIRNLENQKYDTDLVNPLHLALGNLDFSFVLIYFFPLVVIAFSYNLLSEEQERGTWPLVRSQARSPKKMLWKKLSVRYATMAGVLGMLLLAAQHQFCLPLDEYFGALVLLAFLYLTFWFALIWAVTSFDKSSDQNARILLTCWILLTVLVPALINGLTAIAYPVPETFETLMAQREGYHAKWDQPKAPTLQKFYDHYPQFKTYPLPDRQFSWLWYYAMQQMGDDDALAQTKALKNKLLLREKSGSQLALLLPTLHTQLQMNDLCRSGMKNHLAFLDSLAAFHERKRLYFYPKIFSEAPVKSENWKDFNVAYFRDTRHADWELLVAPLCIYILLLGMLAEFNFRKEMQIN
jgi:ABC-2 type transport system permease protein